MPKIETKAHKPASATTAKTNGKAATKRKIPIYKTLPPETDPEIIEANRLFLEAVEAVRKNLANNFEPEPGKAS